MQPEVTTYEVVKKAWGEERIIANNEKYCGKVLVFKKDAMFSMHYHVVKTETWLVTKGKFIFGWIDTDKATHNERYLNIGDVVTLYVGMPHQLKALEDSEIFEVSTTHSDFDSYRVFPGDSQKEKTSG